jgi:hypothetical protein
MISEHRIITDFKLKREAKSKNLKISPVQNISQRRQFAPQFAPQFVPQIVPQVVPQFAPQFAPQIVAQVVPQFAPQTVPQTVPQTAPQVVPQIVPQIVPQTVPQTVPQIEDHVAIIKSAEMQANINGSMEIIGPIEMKYQGTLHLTITNAQNGVDKILIIKNPYITFSTDGDVPVVPEQVSIENVKQENGQVRMTLHTENEDISVNGKYIVTIKDGFEFL